MPNYYSEEGFILQVFFENFFLFFRTFFTHFPCFSEEQALFPSGAATFLRFNIHQHNIRPHAADPAPGNDIVILSAQYAEKSAGAGDDDRLDVPAGNLHTGIGNIAEPPAVGYADHFLAVQLRKFCGHTAPLPSVFGAVYVQERFRIPELTVEN